jgi:hypothetical protein
MTHYHEKENRALVSPFQLEEGMYVSPPKKKEKKRKKNPRRRIHLDCKVVLE